MGHTTYELSSYLAAVPCHPRQRAMMLATQQAIGRMAAVVRLHHQLEHVRLAIAHVDLGHLRQLLGQLSDPFVAFDLTRADLSAFLGLRQRQKADELRL